MIKKPTPIVNTSISQKNINKMKGLCQKWDMDFRPHFKTHQSAAIGQWFIAQGIKKCCVSSVGMASYFASNHWKDITIAIPVNILEIAEINTLAKNIQLSLTVDSLETCVFLSSHLQFSVDLYIEIDTSYSRSGVAYHHTQQINEILELINQSPLMHFIGFLSHSGNTYDVDQAEEIAKIFELSKERMLTLKNKYSTQYPQLIISMGDTPSASFAQNFEGVDEWRPGNFVFYDLMQLQKGVCQNQEIALKLSCPVIGIYPERGEFVIYGGAVHLSKESIEYKNQKVFGLLVTHNNRELDHGFPVHRLSQEHGIITAAKSFLKTLKIGDLVEIVPVHSCLTADLHSHYLCEDGVVLEKWKEC